MVLWLYMVYRLFSLFTFLFLYGAVATPVIAAETQISADTSWTASLESPGSYWHVRDTDVDSPEAYLNVYREALGLDDYAISDVLRQSAQDHADYLAANGVDAQSPHHQTEGNTGFTGQWPDDRCKSLGYDLEGSSFDYCTEIQAGGSADGDIYSALDSLMMTPFHRISMIHPAYAEIGCAQTDGWVVCDIGLDVVGASLSSVGDIDPILYPADGQVISTTFYAVENPVPYPDYYGEFIGPTLMYWPWGVDEPEAEVSLYDLTTGHAIETIISIDTSNSYASNAIFFNPVSELYLDHEYAVYVRDVSGEDEFEDAMWTFKTQSSSNVDFPNVDDPITYDPAVVWAGESSSLSSTESPSSNSAEVEALIDELAGKIMLAVDNHGEAWYIDPITRKRYYLADGPTAYEFLRSFGLGITNADLETIPTVDDVSGGGALASSLSGRILLQVESVGEAWYINPEDLKRSYMADGDAAYTIMRELSLGTMMEWIEEIPVGSLE